MEPPRKKFTSRYYGVSWHKSSQRWAVQIRHDGKRIHVGYFADELEAAIAYDRIARNLRGAHTKTNFHETPESITGEATGAVEQILPPQTHGVSQYAGSGLVENPGSIKPQHSAGGSGEWSPPSHPVDHPTPDQALFSPVRKNQDQQQRFFFGESYDGQKSHSNPPQSHGGSYFPAPEPRMQQQRYPAEGMYIMPHPNTPVETRFDRDMYYYQEHGGVQGGGGHGAQSGMATGGGYFGPSSQMAHSEQYMQHGTHVPHFPPQSPVASGVGMWDGQPQYQRSFSDSGFALQGMPYQQQPQSYGQYAAYKPPAATARDPENYGNMQDQRHFQASSSFHSSPSDANAYSVGRSQDSMQRRYSFDVDSFHGSMPSGFSAMHSTSSMHSVSPRGLESTASHPSHPTVGDPQSSFSVSSSGSLVHSQQYGQTPQNEKEEGSDNGSSWNHGAVEATRILNSMSQNPNEQNAHQKEWLALDEDDYESVDSGDGDEEMQDDAAVPPVPRNIPPTPMRRVAPPRHGQFEFGEQSSNETQKSEAQHQMRRTVTSSEVDARARRQAFQGYLGFGSR